jgi:hypothetical protein
MGLVLRAELFRHVDSVGDRVHVVEPAVAHGLGERLGAADDGARATEEQPHEVRRPLRECEIREAAGAPGAVQRDHEGATAEARDRGAREPIRVHEVGAAGCCATSGDHRDQQQDCEPRPALDGGDDAAAPAARQPEVAVRAGPDDLDVDVPFAQVLDGVEDEPAGEVAVVARVRGREHRHPERPADRLPAGAARRPADRAVDRERHAPRFGIEIPRLEGFPGDFAGGLGRWRGSGGAE